MHKGHILKDICPSLECCIITSEVCTKEDEILLNKAFGITIINEYGSSEIGLIAFPDKENRWLVTHEDLFVEILDDNDLPVAEGEKGRIIVTSLYNKAMPFIRYELGDIASVKEEAGVKVLQQLHGRLNDTIRLPSGRVMPGATLHYASKELMNNVIGLKE
jgi:phenylacetate-CoA ligase